MADVSKYRKDDRYSRVGCHDFEITGDIGKNIYANHVGISCHPCPFSIQAVSDPGNKYGCEHGLYGTIDVLERIKWLLRDIYTEVEDGTDYITLKGVVLLVPDDLVDHTDAGAKEYYLKTSYKGIWGYECVFPNCPHRIITGRNYFYV